PAPGEIPFVLGSLVSVDGLAVMAALSFGDEFQHRTMPLLLSQPRARFDLWREKLEVLLVAAFSLVFVNGPMQQLIPGFPMVLVFLLATACGSGFWISKVNSISRG